MSITSRIAYVVERSRRWEIPSLTSGVAVRNLAPFACNAEDSRGRVIVEPEALERTAFQRDRDRIIHCSAFRRLKHKTQVFVYHEGDHYRTRLTHSLEVAQIARSIARTLWLDEDLTEALALAHDFGHTPFGHAGERALDECMRRFGGFDHNAQSLRIVSKLERRYAEFDGLNLTWETLEGLVKHNGPLLDAAGSPIGVYAETGLPAVLHEFAGAQDLRLETYASAEAQVAALSDDIAYNAHDLDDGLRAGLFDIIDLGDVPIVSEALGDVLKTYPDLERPRLVHETVRRVISAMVGDVVAASRNRIRLHEPKTVEDVRNLESALIDFSPRTARNNKQLKGFLNERMYRHDRVLDVMDRAQRVIRDLFDAYLNTPDKLPKDWQDAYAVSVERSMARHVCDFIAGMTDRYAIDQHKELFDIGPLFR